MNRGLATSVVGLDLAGVETRPTGFCILSRMRARTRLVHSDDEILRICMDTRPKVIAVDAPLSLPEGRESIEQRTNTHLRECDLELLRRHIKFFPVTLGPMRKLTVRGTSISRELKKKGFRVIEVYPGGAQDVLGIPRKQKGLNKLREGLDKAGIKGLVDGLSDHELDAVSCALVGKMFLIGKVTLYGTGQHIIVMPLD